MLQELVVRVKLPGLKQASQAQLNVTSQQLTVSVPGKYLLRLDLPYAVAEAEGSASFNPAKQQLEVTLPAIPPKAPAMATAQLDQQQDQQQGQQQVSVSRSDSDLVGRQDQDSRQQPLSDTGTHELASSSASAAQPSMRQGDSSISAAKAPSQAGRAQQAPATAPVAAEGTSSEADRQPQELLTENQQRWQELHQPTATAANHADAQPAQHTVDVDAMQQAAAAGLLIDFYCNIGLLLSDVSEWLVHLTVVVQGTLVGVHWV